VPSFAFNYACEMIDDEIMGQAGEKKCKVMHLIQSKSHPARLILDSHRCANGVADNIIQSNQYTRSNIIRSLVTVLIPKRDIKVWTMRPCQSSIDYHRTKKLTKTAKMYWISPSRVAQATEHGQEHDVQPCLDQQRLYPTIRPQKWSFPMCIQQRKS
jgi:hypothetical protein